MRVSGPWTSALVSAHHLLFATRILREMGAETKADVQGPDTYQPIAAYDVYLQEERVQQQLFLCKCRSLMYRSLHLYGGGHV